MEGIIWNVYVTKEFLVSSKVHVFQEATKNDEIFTVDLTLYVVSVKSTVKILSIFVAFLENKNFNICPI